jgi:hypothetical protein
MQQPLDQSRQGIPDMAPIRFCTAAWNHDQIVSRGKVGLPPKRLADQSLPTVSEVCFAQFPGDGQPKPTPIQLIGIAIENQNRIGNTDSLPIDVVEFGRPTQAV